MKLYLIYTIAASKVNEEKPSYVILQDQFDTEFFFKNLYLLLRYKHHKIFFMIISALFIFNSAVTRPFNFFMMSSSIILIMLFCGLEGVNWRGKFLESEGYKLAASIMAHNTTEAKEKFFAS